jgi:signal transduction histidine kinase
MKSTLRLALIYAIAAAILLLFAAVSLRAERDDLTLLTLMLLLLGILTVASMQHLVVRPAQKEIAAALQRSQEALEQGVTERTEALRRNAERLSLLHEMDQSLLAAHRPEIIALAAIGRIRRLVPCQRALVTTLEKDGQARVLASQSSGDVATREPAPSWAALYAELLTEPILVQGQIYGVEDLGALTRRSRLQQALYETGIQAYIVVPLLLEGDLVGTLNLESGAARSFTADHVTVAREVATSLAVAIRQARLYAQVQQELQERMEAEAILQRRTTALEVRNAELDAFAHTVAHDLKNPLTAILGYTSLVRNRHRQMSNETKDRYLDVVAQNVRKMTTIVDELLLLASVRAQDEVEAGALDMGHIVDEALARLQYLIDELGGEIQVPQSWPEAWGYAPWIEEVWANYLSNALKYGGRPPRVEVGFTLVEGQKDGQPPNVRYWVRDDGPGLTHEQQQALFTPFERLHQARVDGHGLGLSIVRRIVHKLGGQVGVESGGQPGQGCTFYFSLPAQAAPLPLDPGDTEDTENG